VHSSTSYLEHGYEGFLIHLHMRVLHSKIGSAVPPKVADSKSERRRDAMASVVRFWCGTK